MLSYYEFITKFYEAQQAQNTADNQNELAIDLHMQKILIRTDIPVA